MNKLLVVLGVVIIVSAFLGYYLYNYFNYGQVNVYIQDPPNQGLAVYLTVSSIMIHQTNGSWITLSNRTITVLLSSNMTFLASSKLPVGEYNEIFLGVSSATVQLGSVNVTAKLPSYVFKVHIIGGLKLTGGSTHNVLISFPHLTLSDGEIIISPSVTATVIS